jgi:hypothetical protein
MLGAKRFVEMLHRKVPVTRAVRLDDELDPIHRRSPPRPPSPSSVDQSLCPFRFVAIPQTPEMSLAKAQKLRRLNATQPARSVSLQPIQISRHSYLGSHPDPSRLWNPSKNRTNRLLQNPDICCATDSLLGSPLLRRSILIKL